LTPGTEFWMYGPRRWCVVSHVHVSITPSAHALDTACVTPALVIAYMNAVSLKPVRTQKARPHDVPLLSVLIRIVLLSTRYRYVRAVRIERDE
jgi:hypothetical protein